MPPKLDRKMNPQTILLIEDEPGLRLTIGDRLKSEGYGMAFAAKGAEGFAMASANAYAAIILDVMLPEMSGLDIARDLRARGIATPILMLTAKGEVMDRVLGLKLGADDYLAKPFEMMELLARIEALLRRATLSTSSPAASIEKYEFDDVCVDFKKVIVLRGDRELALTLKEYELLAYFIKHRGDLLSRNQLLGQVWGYEKGISTRTVDVHVASLRQKIEINPEKPQRILTVRSMGYRFAG